MTSRRMRHSPRDQRKIPMLKETLYTGLTPLVTDNTGLSMTLIPSYTHFFFRYELENTVKLSSLTCENVADEPTFSLWFAIYSSARYSANHPPPGDVESGMPLSLMHELGSVDLSTAGVKTLSLTPHIVMRPGSFWLVLTTDNTGSTSLACHSTAEGNAEDSTSDGFPAAYFYTSQETKGVFPEYFDGLSRPTDSQLADAALRVPVVWGISA